MNHRDIAFDVATLMAGMIGDLEKKVGPLPDGWSAKLFHRLAHDCVLMVLQKPVNSVDQPPSSRELIERAGLDSAVIDRAFSEATKAMKKKRAFFESLSVNPLTDDEESWNVN